MTIQEKMGLRIRALREEKQLSQTTLAEKVGYKDKTAVAKVEAGKVDLPQSKIVAFANALNTTPSFLFSDEEDQDIVPPQTVAAHLDADSLTEAELDDVAKYIEFIKSKKHN